MSVILEAHNVFVEFPASGSNAPILAVRDISFELSGGQLLGLVGPNGAGKTTLLRVLAGLQVPTRGEAHLLGKPVLGEHELVRRHIGFAPDAPPAYEEVTVYAFLRFIAGTYGLDRTTTEERIDFWLEQLWLTDRRDTTIKNLSRGMRQRVTLARAFLPRPHVVLLDEPLSGLDPAGRIELRKVLGMLRDQGCAVIVSSHILADLEEVATHVAIIERGAILRWSETDALYHEHTDRRTYQLTTLNGTENCQKVLLATDGVSEVTVDGRVCRFGFHAEENEAAALLRHLVKNDVDVVSFTVTKTTLEEAYLKAGVKQVD